MSELDQAVSQPEEASIVIPQESRPKTIRLATIALFESVVTLLKSAEEEAIVIPQETRPK